MVFDVFRGASEEQADADDDAKQHAAANDLATPRAPETLDGCGLIQGHVHGHRVLRTLNLAGFTPTRDRPPGVTRRAAAGGGGRSVPALSFLTGPVTSWDMPALLWPPP